MFEFSLGEIPSSTIVELNRSWANPIKPGAQKRTHLRVLLAMSHPETIIAVVALDTAWTGVPFLNLVLIGVWCAGPHEATSQWNGVFPSPPRY